MFHCNFTYVSETSYFIELCPDAWRFIPDLADPGLFSTISQFKIYTMQYKNTFTAKTFITIVNRKSLFLFKRLIRYMETHWIILYSAIIYSVITGIKWLLVLKN